MVNSSACTAHALSEAQHEIYRLRIQNIIFGNIEISTDRGIHFALIGRVMEPATAPELDKTAKFSGTVIRSSSSGIAFTMGKNEVLKLLPNALKVHYKYKKLSNKHQKNEMRTNTAPGTGLFSSLAPPECTQVQLQFEDNAPRPVDENTVINDEDALVFAVSLSHSQPAVSNANQDDHLKIVYADIEKAASQYSAAAINCAEASGAKIVSGMLTLKARFVPGEPEPIVAVSYLIDSEVVYAQNTAPFEHSFDTKEIKDGEHVVEIRGFDKKGNPISRKRSLVVIRNRP